MNRDDDRVRWRLWRWRWRGRRWQRWGRRWRRWGRRWRRSAVEDSTFRLAILYIMATCTVELSRVTTRMTRTKCVNQVIITSEVAKRVSIGCRQPTRGVWRMGMRRVGMRGVAVGRVAVGRVGVRRVAVGRVGVRRMCVKDWQVEVASKEGAPARWRGRKRRRRWSHPRWPSGDARSTREVEVEGEARGEGRGAKVGRGAREHRFKLDAQHGLAAWGHRRRRGRRRRGRFPRRVRRRGRRRRRRRRGWAGRQHRRRGVGAHGHVTAHVCVALAAVVKVERVDIGKAVVVRLHADNDAQRVAALGAVVPAIARHAVGVRRAQVACVDLVAPLRHLRVAAPLLPQRRREAVVSSCRVVRPPAAIQRAERPVPSRGIVLEAAEGRATRV